MHFSNKVLIYKIRNIVSYSVVLVKGYCSAINNLRLGSKESFVKIIVDPMQIASIIDR